MNVQNLKLAFQVYWESVDERLMRSMKSDVLHSLSYWLVKCKQTKAAPKISIMYAHTFTCYQLS